MGRQAPTELDRHPDDKSIDSQDADIRAIQRLRFVFSEQASTLRDAVVDGFAVTPDTLNKIASPQTLDRVIRNCLTVRLKDAQLANDVYTDLQQQVVRPNGAPLRGPRFGQLDTHGRFKIVM